MISMRKEPKFPEFIEVDRAKITTMDQLNKYINDHSDG